MNLKHAEVGKYYRIVKILGKGPVKRRIMDMGITKNVEIYIRSSSNQFERIWVES